MSIAAASALLLAAAQPPADPAVQVGFVDTIRLDGAGKVLSCTEEAVGPVAHPPSLQCAPFSEEKALQHWLGPLLRQFTLLKLRMLFTPATADSGPPEPPTGGPLRMTIANLKLTFAPDGRQSGCEIVFQIADFDGQSVCDDGRDSPSPIATGPAVPAVRQAWLTFDISGQ